MNKEIWNQNQLGAWVCKLGTLDKAIVVVRSKQIKDVVFKWRISKSSYLPFTTEQYEREFGDAEDCIDYAESIVLEWLNSLTINQKQIHKNNQNQIEK